MTSERPSSSRSPLPIPASIPVLVPVAPPRLAAAAAATATADQLTSTPRPFRGPRLQFTPVYRQKPVRPPSSRIPDHRRLNPRVVPRFTRPNISTSTRTAIGRNRKPPATYHPTPSPPSFSTPSTVLARWRPVPTKHGRYGGYAPLLPPPPHVHMT